MPGFKTHSIFGVLSSRHLADGYIKKCITKYPHAYQMGHQGPDFMFYYAPLHLFYKRNPGDIMHSTLVNHFFDFLFNARNNVKKVDQPIVDSYISGFIGHYTLDSAIHPYIYFRTNHMQHESEKTYDFGLHSFLETDVDQACLRHFMKTDIIDYKPWDKISMSTHEIKVLSNLISNCINAVYNDINISSFSVACAFYSMREEQYFMRDPKSTKKNLLRLIDEKTVHHAFLSTMVPFRGSPYYNDPCNTKHKLWYNPWDQSKTTHDDIYKIIIQNENILNKRILLYQAMINSKNNDYVNNNLKLLTELGDNSYLTGLPLDN